MKKTLILIAALGVAAVAWIFWSRRVATPTGPESVAVPRPSTSAPSAATKASAASASVPSQPGGATSKRPAMTPEEKAARIAKISRDYEEIMAKAAADFTAAGAAFPGGFSAYLRQLALLEREKWNDYAAFLSPRELEDLQFREHRAGKLVMQWLGDTAATDEQRRTVLRMQREFEDKYSLIFDLTPPSLASRETERQALQEQILAVLGPNLFAAWLRAEGPDYANLVRFTDEHGIRPEASLEVWRIKNEFTRRRLEITAQYGRTGEAGTLQGNLLDQTRARVSTILGPAALQSAATSGLGWLPTK